MNNRKITTIFFDWGGVIASDPGAEFLANIVRGVGATEPQIQEIFQTYMRRFMRGQISETDYWRKLKEHYNLEIHDTISDEFKKWDGLAANQDVLEIAKQAKSQGIKIAVLSNVIEPTYNALVEASDYTLFDDVIASCKVGYAKPDREIYELALERMGATASESLFIDDKQIYLDPATELGFATILAQSPEQIVRDIRQYL